jgi:hypothetical protein
MPPCKPELGRQALLLIAKLLARQLYIGVLSKIKSALKEQYTSS